MLRQVTRELGALLILDEVITFRLGYHGAQGLFGIDPDLTTLGKLIGGGFPIGAVGGRRDVMAVFDPSNGTPAVPHGGTFSANPMSMAAGIATLQDLPPAAYARLEALGAQLDAGVREAFLRHRQRGQLTGLGSLRRIHFTNAPLTDYRSVVAAPSVANFANRLFDNGVIIAQNGLIALSTAMTETDVAEIVSAIDHTLAAENDRQRR